MTLCQTLSTSESFTSQVTWCSYVQLIPLPMVPPLMSFRCLRGTSASIPGPQAIAEKAPSLASPMPFSAGGLRTLRTPGLGKGTERTENSQCLNRENTKTITTSHHRPSLPWKNRFAGIFPANPLVGAPERQAVPQSDKAIIFRLPKSEPSKVTFYHSNFRSDQG